MLYILHLRLHNVIAIIWRMYNNHQRQRDCLLASRPRVKSYIIFGNIYIYNIWKLLCLYIQWAAWIIPGKHLIKIYTWHLMGKGIISASVLYNCFYNAQPQARYKMQRPHLDRWTDLHTQAKSTDNLKTTLHLNNMSWTVKLANANPCNANPQETC